MLGKQIKNSKTLEQGDIIVEKRERFKGLEAEIKLIFSDGADIRITKPPNQNKNHLIKGEVFFFDNDDLKKFFLKKVNQNSIKKL